MRIAMKCFAWAVCGLVASSAWGATPTFYASRPAFQATLGTSVTDGYDSPPYPAGLGIYDNATMSAFLGETDYETTGFLNWNIIPGNGTYCAGCNGSFRLTFTSTSQTAGGVGVFGAGVDIPNHNLSTPYFAYIAYGDGTFQSVALPAAGSFWGVTAPELIVSIHFGLTGGGTTISGSFSIDNLTIGRLCSLTCPANVVASTAPGLCSATVSYAAPTTAGTCGVVTCTPASGGSFGLGTTPISCTSELNGGVCGFDVTVADNEPPALTCPADVAVDAPPGALSTIVDFTVPTATDNCSLAGPATCDPTSGDPFAVGTTTVVCAATDGSGNGANCDFDVTVGTRAIQEIPTASEWGLAALALLLGAAALLVLRRSA